MPDRDERDDADSLSVSVNWTPLARNVADRSAFLARRASSNDLIATGVAGRPRGDVLARPEEARFENEARFRFAEPILSAELIDEAVDLSLEADDLSRQVTILAKSLRENAEAAASPTMPTSLSGTLIQPTGAPGAALAISLRRKSTDDGETPLSAGVTVTDAGGRFALVPGDAALPAAGVDLLVQGADTRTTIPLSAEEVQAGQLGPLTLDRPLAPLPDTVRRQLAPDMDGNDHAVRLGEGENCARRFSSNAGVIDRYSWLTLIRLVEPKVFPPQGKT